MTDETTPDYRRGYDDAQETDREDLANQLRKMMHSGELSARLARDIFTGVYGLVIAIEEFGPDNDPLMAR